MLYYSGDRVIDLPNRVTVKVKGGTISSPAGKQPHTGTLWGKPWCRLILLVLPEPLPRNGSPLFFESIDE